MPRENDSLTMPRPTACCPDRCAVRGRYNRQVRFDFLQLLFRRNQMTNEQWEQLLSVIKGEVVDPLPVGFIIDSPWLPGWAGITTLDYFTNEQIWFDANLKAIRQFPDVMFLPGFWSEFGMCTEPSAFGSKSTWHENELPFADKIIKDIKSVSDISKPEPKTDGMLPFVLNRLKRYQSQIEREGHAIRFDSDNASDD